MKKFREAVVDEERKVSRQLFVSLKKVKFYKVQSETHAFDLAIETLVEQYVCDPWSFISLRKGSSSI